MMKKMKKIKRMKMKNNLDYIKNIISITIYKTHQCYTPLTLKVVTLKVTN